MINTCIRVIAGLLAAALAPAHAADAPVPAPFPATCGMCEEWNVPQQPFNVAANTWYVGTKELTALLITGPQGHILLDGALSQSATQIENNIKALGFRLEDVKLIVNSHAHFDHAGGIAALQAKSGAQVAASAHGAQALREGTNSKDDPQYEPNDLLVWPKVGKVREVTDGETLSVGTLAITAHLTPGHTPGSTTWTWQSCQKKRCLSMVYADSLTAISSDGFRYTGNATEPDRSAAFKAAIGKVAALKCDVIVSTHPGATNTMDKLARRTPRTNPFIEPKGCVKYAAAARANLEARLAKEAASAAKAH